MYGQSIIWSQDLTLDWLAEIGERANHFRKKPLSKSLKNKKVAMLFFEESTRTRFSFETSALDLGGAYISTENARLSSSVAKGESLEHTVRVISAYCDAIVLRHPDDDAARKARDFLQSQGIDIPFFNAGCGGIKGQHPSQSALDRYTINDEIGRTSNIRVALVGDLLRGRTVRSLAYLLGKEPGNSVDLISPWELPIGEDMLAYFHRHNVTYTQGLSLDDVIDKVDVVYMTRVQKERPLENGMALNIDTTPYRMTATRAQRMQRHARIMHPLPIVDEVEKVVDRFPWAAYFRQSDNGVPVRKALLEMVLGE
jgi:aspartate carbamoyltransferase catalytic subunit